MAGQRDSSWAAILDTQNKLESKTVERMTIWMIKVAEMAPHLVYLGPRINEAGTESTWAMLIQGIAKGSHKG